MDGNARAKRIAKRLGFKMQNVQQTFVVPSDPGAEGGWDRADDDLVEWLEFAHDFLLERDLTPTLNDVLFVPRDRSFLLSASADLPGFAVSYAFETSNRASARARRKRPSASSPTSSGRNSMDASTWSRTSSPSGRRWRRCTETTRWSSSA